MTSEPALMKAAAGSQRDESCAHYYVGLCRLAEGDRFKAQEQLHKALDTACPNTFCHDLAVIFLTRLQRDPAWPPWIPAKK